MARRRDIDRLQDEIHELFADLWQVPRFSGLAAEFRPEVDLFRTDDPPQLTVVVELAGVDPGDVRLAATDSALVIAGERRRPRTHAGRYQLMEIEYGPFQRRIPLTDTVDASAARATYERGMLTIVLPLAAARPPAEPVSIEVMRV